MKRKALKTILFIVLVNITFSSCVTTFKTKGNVKLNEPDYSIENMTYLSDDTATTEFKKIAKAIKSKLMKSGISEFGYFAFTTKWAGSDDLYGLTLTVSIVTLGVANVLGFPTDWASEYDEFTLYLFDSNGDLIKKFNATGKSSGIAGLYYDTSSGDRTTSHAINQIFKDMEDYADEINIRLRQAGPNTPEKDKLAREKIESYFDKLRGKNKSTSSSPSSSYVTYSTPTPSQNTNSVNTTKSFQQGKYVYSGTSIYMRFTSGIVNAYDGYNNIGLGTYQIQGERLIITWTSLSSDVIKNNTYVLNILDDSTLDDGGERWVRTGW